MSQASQASQVRPSRSPLVTPVLVALALLAPEPPALGADGALTTAGDAGLGAVGDAVASTLSAGLDLRGPSYSLAVFGRVRLVLDQSRDEPSGVRRRDYDELADYVHLLRQLRYQGRADGVGFRLAAGELVGATLGHGTLLRDYSNVADPDHMHTGVRAEIDAEPLALELVIDNVLAPAVLAGRLAWRPLARAPALAVGASVAFDPRAPRRVLLGADGARLYDRAFHPRADTALLPLSGVDVEYSFGDGRHFRIVPYADGNTSWRGVGGHFGALGELALGASGLLLRALGEYAVVAGGYAPALLDTFYDVTRYQSGLAFSRASRATAAQRAPVLESLAAHAYAGGGFSVEGGVEVGERLLLQVGYRDHPGPDRRRLWLRLVANPLPPLTVGALVLLRGFGRAEGAAASPSVAVLSEVRYQLGRHFYALGQYTRTWAVEASSGLFLPLQGFNFAIGTQWAS
ncbi:MAG: hypothetical protein IPL40_01820 [Proteobacteria bacterium]|nr:hypothetical protein [Pseudomonadota bacterium]